MHHHPPSVKFSASRVIGASLVAGWMFAAAGCTAARLFVGLSATPETVPVPIDRGGYLQPIDLVLYGCEVISPAIYFHRRELADANLQGLVGALPGDDWKPKPGVPLRLQVTFTRQVDGPDRGVVWRSIDATTQIVEMWSDEDVGRIFGHVTLPAGRYRAEAVLVEGRPELAALHPTFKLWSTFKTQPDPAKCSEPPPR